MDLQVSFVVLVVGNISNVLRPWNIKGLGTNRRTINNYFCNFVFDLTTRKMSYLFFQTILFCFQSKKDWMQFNESPIHWFMKNDLNKEECIKETNENKNEDFEDNFEEYRWIPCRRQKNRMIPKLKRTWWWCARCGICNRYFSFISYCCYFILFCHVLKLLVVSLF